ncbi:hypothetical protein [Pedobacter insulae]|nr:hypothetical protein [Pedobacter insulae]
MSEIEKYPVLDYIVDTLKNAIADTKIENPSANEYRVKDGNDEIHLKQNGQTVTITDKRNIIFSEDLLETLQNIHEGVKRNDALKAELQAATIIINGLDIETELILQAIKDSLDQLSNSYEFLQVVDSDINKIGVGFKFGKHAFRLNITNESNEVLIETRFTPTFDTTVKQTITSDLTKVQNAVNKLFKSS